MGEMPTTLRVEQLPSGVVYGYVLPNVQRMFLAGFFPQPIVPLVRQFLSSKVESDTLQSDDDIKQWEEFKGRLVAWMVRAEGGDVKPILDEDGATVRDPFSRAPEFVVVEMPAAVTYTWEQVLDPEAFPPDDLAALFSRALRVVAAPKAVKANA